MVALHSALVAHSSPQHWVFFARRLSNSK